MQTFHNIGTSTDWIVMVVYFLVIMLFGSYFGGIQKLLQTFSLADADFRGG